MRPPRRFHRISGVIEGKLGGANPVRGDWTGAGRRAGKITARYIRDPGSQLAMKEHPRSDSTVFVIDDDAAVRTVLKELFESVGLKVQLFSSGNAFLEAPVMDTPCCLVLDVRLPGMSGLKLQEELTKAEVHVPIIFLSAHGDIHMAVGAMKAGAVDFLTKPFRNQDVLDAVYAALELDGTRRKKEQSNSTLRERFETLSPRERDVVTRVAAGELNKQIAAELGLSEVTVKVHRAKAMRKMHAKSLAELVRMTDNVQHE